ncbi:UDP-N-acetylmuramate:L-alanyl-gamma-D-glutamyl-meso-diaminopimelate ligase [hydrothermal vent metagenome]|uniref:UDP-N-acetylmuramate:L-alanyl-gamma-D-glutamyl-meso-diaminopimelate ligase n=1 Tax=hydrothermal vent metagenome TaxID=652676 RepID=A0A3B0Z8Y9_9ZZZZ
MHIHILGICGTFMGGIAQLARQMGYTVSGSDANVYPPMSTQLEQAGIQIKEGFHPTHLEPEPDLVVIGNAMSRGNPLVELVLNRGMRYCSGPAFLAEHILPQRWVIGVSGTHGKTTTSAMIAWILEHAGFNPGFLIGGVPSNFDLSARLGSAPFFVVEADEYDTAFFDKRSKFVHYQPRTLVINNLEFDHADIFANLDEIKRQFHHLIRTVPSNGRIIFPDNEQEIHQTLKIGCWTPQELIASPAGWEARNQTADGSAFDVYFEEKLVGRLSWSLIGQHNVFNALAAIAAARHAGIRSADAVAALCEFSGVKRRLELRGVVNNISIYDDFAHHPTAIATTLEGLRQRVGPQARIVAVMEPRSNTMRMGVHKESLANSLREANQVLILQPKEIDWSIEEMITSCAGDGKIFDQVSSIIEYLQQHTQAGDHILIMSNGGFGDIHAQLLAALGGDEKPE